MARISKIYRILISALLAFLGFSCVNGNREGAEYGTPSATYKAKGVVVSEADNSPIEGIRAVLKDDRDGTIDTSYPYPWAGHTDNKGSFFLEHHTFPHKKLYVELTDVDGEENGSFAKMVVEADFTNATYTGGSGHWYYGEAEIDLGTIKMKPK